MIIVQDRIYIQLKIDQKELPSSPNLVQNITMTEGMSSLSPAIELVLNDYNGSLNRELALTDGNEILVTVGKAPNDLNTISRQYRLFGTRQQTTGFGPQIKVIGIYDAPNYLTRSSRESYTGTSSEALRDLASRCRLEFDGPEAFNGKSPQDSQRWLNVCKSRALFAQEMSRNGYIDEHSCMAVALTSLGILRYKNLSDLIETPLGSIKSVFVHNLEQAPDGFTAYQIREARDRSSAGLMNSWQNYGSTRVEHDLSGEQKDHAKVGAKSNAEYLPINDQVAQTVERARVEYSPLDCGNTHINYYKALHQNIKLLSLFSEHMSILTTDTTQVQLFDVVLYKQANSVATEQVNKSDIYIVIGKSIQARNGITYAERIELVRMSLPVKGESKLSGTTPGSAADSVIPNSQIDPTSRVSAQTFPTMKSITSFIAPVQSAMNVVKSTIGQLTNAVSYTLPQLKNLNNMLQFPQMNLSPQLLVKTLLATAPSLAHYIQSSQQFSLALQGAVPQLSQMNLNLSGLGVNSAVRQATLANPGGVLDSFTSSLGGVRQQLGMVNILNPILNEINKAVHVAAISTVANGPQALLDFNTSVGLANTNFMVGSSSAVGLWNNSLGVLTGLPVPAKPTVTSSSALLSMISNLYAAPSSRSSIAQPLQNVTSTLVKSIMTRTSDRTPSWLPSGPIQRDTSLDLAGSGHEIDQLLSDTPLAKLREREMYPESWTA